VKDFTRSGSEEERKERNQFTRKDSEPRIKRNGSDLQTKTQVTPKLHHTSLKKSLLSPNQCESVESPNRSIQTLTLTKIGSESEKTFRNPQTNVNRSKFSQFHKDFSQKTQKNRTDRTYRNKTRGFTLIQRFNLLFVERFMLRRTLRSF